MLVRYYVVCVVALVSDKMQFFWVCSNEIFKLRF